MSKYRCKELAAVLTNDAPTPPPRPPPFQRANAVKREPELQAFWDEERVYERMLEDNTGEKYVLHDGPPYANGDLHIGHALNKVRYIEVHTLRQGQSQRRVMSDHFDVLVRVSPHAHNSLIVN